MKRIKRVISILITVILCLSAAACAGAGEPETVPEFDVSDTFEDMDGFVMDFSFALPNMADDEIVLGYIPNTQLADIAAKRVTDVEKMYNCKINVMYSPNYSEAYNQLNASVFSGLHFCDLINNESFAMVNLARAGGLIGLSDYLDMTDFDKWGSKDMLFSMCWDDDVYAVVPAAWPDLVYTGFGHPLCVNTDLVRSLGGTDLREYVEDMTWTWDKLEETLQFLTRTEGENTIYGISCHPTYFVGMMATSNGDRMIEYRNGQFICGYFTPTGKAALERAQDIFQRTCHDCFYPGNDQYIAIDVFTEGRSCMICPPTENIFGNTGAILFKVDNVAVIPFPMGPNATDYSTQGVYSSLMYCTSIPLNCTEPETTAKILDALYAPFDEYPTKDAMIEYMAQQIFFDAFDAEAFVNMRETAQYNFFLEGGRKMIEETERSNKTVTELMESLEGYYRDLEEEYMIHHYNGQQAVWGK